MYVHVCKIKHYSQIYFNEFFRKNSHNNKPWTEKSPKTVTSNLRASSEPFIPPSYAPKPSNVVHVQATTLVPVEVS